MTSLSRPPAPGFSPSRLVVACGALLALSVSVAAQRGNGNNNPIASLKGVAVPRPADLSRYVTDQQWLVTLGKALFWDVQVGSDGRTACATCHFHAGADHRVRNQIAGPATSTSPVRPNTLLTAGDFPFHAFADPANNASAVTRDRRDVVGSAGVVGRSFVDVSDGGAADVGADTSSPGAFSLGGLRVRQVTSRNAPSVINAVFNVRNFWDGRANDTFNAVTPFGAADTRAIVMVVRDGALVPEGVRLDASSLASQAVGPPVNAIEMSFNGRSWPHLGRKMLAASPLSRQVVSASDSVLGPSANVEGTGLRQDVTYEAMIRASFQPAYWSSRALVDSSGRVVASGGEPARPGEFTQMAFNFGLFFGIAVQAYEATLVSDDTPVDRFLSGDTTALTTAQQQGLNEFRNGGSQCTQCHQGPELSAAGVTTAARGAPDPRALGLFRTGVSAIEDDPGAAGLDGFGAPLFPGAPGNRASGAFKSPALRNVDLTGPYFHTGGAATLEQVLEFYARNGDVTTGGNLGPGIGNIRLNQQERGEIVEFLKALTDDRVRFERAPFDHPSLCVAVGYAEDTPGVLTPDTAQGAGAAAADVWALVPAVGRSGSAIPLQTFSELLQGIGRDGSRAHALQQPCTP